jgi:uncharacterized protein (TIGR00251 family)
MRIYIKVIPRASKNEIVKVSEGEYKVKLTAAPVSGQANKMLVEVLAKYFKLPKSRIIIAGGKTARIKMIDINQM